MMDPASPCREGQDEAGEAVRGSFVDLVPVAILLADPNGVAIWANRVWTQLTGQTEPEWRGHGWLGVGGNDDDDVRRDGLLAAARSGAAHRTDWTVSANGHPPRTLEVQAVPDLEHGRLVRIVVTAADVTDDRTRSARLLDQATHDSLTGLFNRAQFLEFLRHALDRRRRSASGMTAVLFVDVDQLKASNDRAGHAAGDRILRDVAARITAAVRPADVVARYGGDEFTILCEDLNDVAEAETIAARIRAVSHRAPARDVSIGIAISADRESDPATIVAEADRSMYEAKRSRAGTSGAVAARADRARREEHEGVRLIAVAAHEMRTPLTTIEGCASTLRANRGQLQDTDVEAALDVIERQTQRLVVMLDQLLELGQCDNGAPALAPVDLADVVSSALEAAPPPPHVSVTRTSPPAVSLVVTADRSRVTRALVNLLTNAYRYGGPHITIDSHNGAADVTISVQDDGPGIPSALGERIFAPFVRGGVGGPSPPTGSGLGLALARDIAESCGGQLTHERVEPHGARFVLRLPATAPRTGPSSRKRRQGHGPRAR